MSLSWPSHYRLVLTPHRATAFRLTLRGQLMERTEADVDNLQSLDGLKPLLAKLRPGKMDVRLSQHLVKMQLMPAAGAALSGRESERYIQDRFRRTHGDVARHWTVRWQPEPGHRPFLACAIDSAWLESFSTLLGQNGLALHRLSPWFTASFNRYRARMAKQASDLALIEPERITLARIDQGRWLSLKSQRFSEQPAETLAGMLSREALLGTSASPESLWLESAGVSDDWRALAQSLGRRLHMRPSGNDTATMMAGL